MAQARVLEYFVVCGLGPDVKTMDGKSGFQGFDQTYMPSLVDQFPPTISSGVTALPPQLPLCALPAGVEFYSSGPISGDESSQPRSYPIILTDGEGAKIYVSCVAFRDPVDEDVAQAYRIPSNTYVDKCICIVSHAPCFQVCRETLEELHRVCFSSSGCSKLLWDIVGHVVLSVPLPSPGGGTVLFSIENHLLSIEVPSKADLPHADLSFQPLIQCLDVDNVIRLFTAVFLERHVLLRASKYSLLTLVAEAICHLLYPIKWQHVFIPVLFYGGVEYLDAPTPYMMGLHSSVEIIDQKLDGVAVVDLDRNIITLGEEMPSIPEPELGQLRADLVELLHPNLADMDRVQENAGVLRESRSLRGNKPWSTSHDTELRLIFLKFFATILSGYRDFVENTAANVFNKDAFLRKRSRITGVPRDIAVDQFLSSQGFLEFLEKGYGSPNAGPNLMDKLQQAMSRGQNPSVVLPGPAAERNIVTISDYSSQEIASRSKYRHDRFPSRARTPEQQEERKRILEAATAIMDRPTRPSSSNPGLPQTGLSPLERAAERERMVLDIKVKLQGLWQRLLVLGSTEDPLASSEYGTILALIESDAEGIGGSGFIECIGEHINSGWTCVLTEEQFIAVKELIKTTVSRAISRNDMVTIRAALEFSAVVYRKDVGSVADYIQRHLGVLPIWDELRFWDGYFDCLMDSVADKSGNFATLVSEQLVMVSQHMAGVGLPDAEAWFILESIAKKHNLGSKQLIKLRGLLAYMQQVRIGYWGFTPVRSQTTNPGGANQSQFHATDETPQPVEAAGATRSWVQSMFSRDKAAIAGRSHHGTSDSNVLVANDNIQNIQQPKVVDGSSAALRRGPSSVRTLRGHKAAVTVLHAVTKAECGEHGVDHDDTGHFISGSADCTVKVWDPSQRGSELRATLKGHTRSIRAIASDRVRIVTGSDDQRVLVWDKATGKQTVELKAHNDKISCVRMLWEPCVLTASHDGTVKMWDVRTDTCVATVGRSASAILCLDYDYETRILAAAGMDGVCNIWDTQATKQRHKLLGHSKWIRCLRMAGDTVITGSDDWTVRVWSLATGVCDSVLTCHSGAINSVEYSAADKGIVTGSADGMVRMWERDEGMLRCTKNVGIHSASILSLRIGERWLAIGAADNSMSLFQRSELKAGGGNRAAGWQLFRTPQRMATVVRCVASDPEKGRICSGARNGLVRLWDAAIAVQC
ncbi:hypothetical protein GOP47_0000156 [Adiantum capillus-veneris]|uniref:UDENN domain-containing protein n=1 Tax=Adiantum capillus-veneris TaxID=13818 RepID=A0A9D4VD22_ADICA|nr:hypothetical protein GOP47_0000156 [Adiantum capillus-veneris]